MVPLKGYAHLSTKPNHIILSILQPKSDANAWKPSYVQRKRHQLTALAFEAKQKEQEHAVTRAKQARTKAETYGKYGYGFCEFFQVSRLDVSNHHPSV